MYNSDMKLTLFDSASTHISSVLNLQDSLSAKSELSKSKDSLNDNSTKVMLGKHFSKLFVLYLYFSI